MSQKTTCIRIHTIAKHGMFRIEQWRDGSKAWRAGFNWYDEDDCEFVCEKGDFSSAVLAVYKYVRKHYILPAEAKTTNTNLLGD